MTTPPIKPTQADYLLFAALFDLPQRTADDLFAGMHDDRIGVGSKLQAIARHRLSIPSTVEETLRSALESDDKPKIGEGRYDYAKREHLPMMLREQLKDVLFFQAQPHVVVDAWNIVQMAADELEAALKASGSDQ